MARGTLTRERIVSAAIELLDAEGLEGLNMRRLGAELGSAATAVYWHVESKDNLLALAGDQVWGEIDLPELDAVGWRDAATAMATELHAMFTRHSWLVQAFGSHLFGGPGKARHDDHSLAVYEKAGFVGADADQAMTTVFLFVLGSAVGEAASGSLRRSLNRNRDPSGRDADDLIREAIAEQTAIAMRFPRLRARIESAVESDYYAAPERTFEFGLEAILDGLERALRRDRGSAG